jgi:tripartite-type tricarboxylate transporter receptor subunit TctC
MRIAILFIATVCVGAVSAQTYPTRPVRIIVPAAPGGTVDLVARSLAQGLTSGLGQTVLIENKPGASTNLGNDYVAKANADGHTLLMSGITLSTNGHLYPKLSYDPIKDFAPITLVATSGNVLVMNPNQPVRTVKELNPAASSTARPQSARPDTSRPRCST